MQIELPILPATSMRFAGDRRLHSIQWTETAMFEVAAVGGSECPVIHSIELRDTVIAWRRYGGETVRPILTPAGTVADMEDLRQATGPTLVNVGSDEPWWHDHPSAIDLGLTRNQDPLAQPIYPELVRRSLANAIEATALTTRADEIERVRWTSEAIVIIDAIAHIRAERPGWMVTLYRGQFFVTPWLPGALGPSWAPAAFFPDPDATRLVPFGGREKAIPDEYCWSGDVTAATACADRATLRSLVLHVSRAIENRKLHSVPESLLWACQDARLALCDKGASCADPLSSLWQAAKVSGIDRVIELAAFFELRDGLIDRSAEDLAYLDS